MEIVRKHTFLLWVFIYRPGYLTEGMLIKSTAWPAWRPLSLPMNHESCCSYPCAALSWIWTGPMTKKTQSDTVWLPRWGPKKPCLYLSIHSVFVCFCSEQLPYCERHRAHGEAPSRYPRQNRASSAMWVSQWVSQCGHPTQLGVQMTPALVSTRLQQHERPQVRITQLSPVNPQNHEK